MYYAVIMVIHVDIHADKAERDFVRAGLVGINRGHNPTFIFEQPIRIASRPRYRRKLNKIQLGAKPEKPSPRQ